MARVPRNAPPGRLSSGLLSEALERDLGVSDSQATKPSRFNFGTVTGTLTVRSDQGDFTQVAILEICGPVIVTEEAAGHVKLDFVVPVQTLELSAQPAGADELIRQSIVPYDVGWADQYRYVIYESNTNGNDYLARYYDGAAWQNVGTMYTTAGAQPLSYVSEWQDIPAAWKLVGDAFLQVVAANEPDPACDVPYAAIQFRRFCDECTTLLTAPSCGTVTIVPDGTITTEALPEFGETPVEAPPP